MKIILTKLGKRFNRDWIFRNLDFEFHSEKKYAITGPNGSGKSTLLQIISGSALHNEGSINYFENDQLLASEKIFQKISFAAPYLEVIEEMTLTEFFSFHNKMKGWQPEMETKEIITIVNLQKAAHKQIRYFSSGMKQRVKLAQAIFSDTRIVLLQIISGSALHNEGSIHYFENDQSLASEKIFQKISFAAPYLEVIEEMTLTEFFSFHHKMKGWLSALEMKEIISIINLQKAAHKQIRYFSSGMKQRVKLAQAIFSDTPIVLLDEPLTNLDEEGVSLYNNLIENYCKNRMLIISSNDKKEYSFCEQIIDLMQYKK